jgi:hypothetical protein
MLFFLLGLQPALTNAATREGSVKNLSKTSKKIVNDSKRCKENNTCTLKSFTGYFDKYKIFVKGAWNWGNSAVFSYETEDVKDLEDYVIVQYIKGCVYNTVYKDGKIGYVGGIVTPSFDELIPFNYSSWTIDSIDKDPVYNSVTDDEGKPLARHTAYRWNSVEGSHSKKTETYYSYELPTKAALYVTDHPGGQAWGIPEEHYHLPAGNYTDPETGKTTYFEEKNALLPAKAKNISLELKTCIHKNKDVPLVSTSDQSISNPIACIEWSTGFKWDFNEKKMLFTDKPHDYCLGKVKSSDEEDFIKRW